MKLTARHLLALTALSLLTLAIGCSDRDPASLPAAEGNVDPLVFDDAYGDNVYFQAFFQTHVTAVSFDSVYAYGGFAADGARSLKFNVAPQGSALGLYTGGVLTTGGARDMAPFNALTFYARATYPITLNLAGFGNDNTGNSLFEAGRNGVPLTTDWTFIVVPIPNSAKLRSERGMLTIAEAVEDAHPEGYDIWLDEIRYAQLSNIVVFRPSMTSAAKMNFIGASVAISGTRTIFQIDGAYVPVDHMANYFDFTSSEPAVAVVEGSTVRLIGLGQSTITATLGEVPVLGSVQVTGYAPPTVAAAAPTLPAASVISLFSGAYTDSPVDTWRTDWTPPATRLESYSIGGDETKLYSDLAYVGIDFQNQPIDATAMTHLHLDVYAPVGTNFKVKLGSFPTAGGASVETQDLILTTATTPAFNSGGWSSLDIPLADFQLPAENWQWDSLGQMVLSTTDAKLVLVDNVYFHQ